MGRFAQGRFDVLGVRINRHQWTCGAAGSHRLEAI